MIETGLGGRVVLITGANGGIGAAAAEAFAAEGAAVAVHFLDADPGDATAYRREHTLPGRAAAEAVAERIRRRGGRACVVAGELADAKTPPALFEAVERALGPVDVIVNNAAHCETPDTTLEIGRERSTATSPSTRARQCCSPPSAPAARGAGRHLRARRQRQQGLRRARLVKSEPPRVLRRQVWLSTAPRAWISLRL